MPYLSRLFLRTAIAFLILGVLTGLHMSSARHLGAGGFHAPYIVAHTHIILIGFVVMTVMGAALWMLPPSRGRRIAWLDGAVYVVLTVTTLVRFTLEVLSGYRPAGSTSLGIFVVSAVQTAALVAFFTHLLPRIHGPPRGRDDDSRTSES